MKRLLRYAPLLVGMLLFAGCGKQISRDALVDKLGNSLRTMKSKHQLMVDVVGAEKSTTAARQKLGDLVSDLPVLKHAISPFMTAVVTLAEDATWLLKRAQRLEERIDILPSDLAFIEALKDFSNRLYEAQDLLKTHNEYKREVRHAEMQAAMLAAISAASKPATTYTTTTTYTVVHKR